MNRLRSCAALAAGAALAACAVLAPEDEPRRVPAAAFDLIGRVAVSYDGRAFSSSVRWQHTAHRDEIWLLTPVGQTLAHITGDAAGAILTGTDLKQYRAGSVESLTRRALGWELPVARLSYWVQGELAPGVPAQSVERDSRARLTRLTQDGWRIVISHFPEDQHEGRPRRLELASGTSEIRLVIDGWRTSEGGP